MCKDDAVGEIRMSTCIITLFLALFYVINGGFIFCCSLRSVCVFVIVVNGVGASIGGGQGGFFLVFQVFFGEGEVAVFCCF